MAAATVLNARLACASACWHERAWKLLQNTTATRMTVSDRLRPRVITRSRNRLVERGAVAADPNLDNRGRGGESRQRRRHHTNVPLRPFHSSLKWLFSLVGVTRCTYESYAFRSEARKVANGLHRVWGPFCERPKTTIHFQHWACMGKVWVLWLVCEFTVIACEFTVGVPISKVPSTR